MGFTNVKFHEHKTKKDGAKYKIAIKEVVTVPNKYFGIKGGFKYILKIIVPYASTNLDLLPGLSGNSYTESEEEIVAAASKTEKIFQDLAVDDKLFDTAADDGSDEGGTSSLVEISNPVSAVEVVKVAVGVTATKFLAKKGGKRYIQNRMIEFFEEFVDVIRYLRENSYLLEFCTNDDDKMIDYVNVYVNLLEKTMPLVKHVFIVWFAGKEGWKSNMYKATFDFFSNGEFERKIISMAKLLLIEPIFKGEYKHYLPKKVDSLLQKSVFHIWNDLAPPKHKIDPSSPRKKRLGK